MHRRQTLSIYHGYTDILPVLLPARAPGHGEGPLSLGALVLALSCLPSLRSLGPRRGLVQALEAVAGQPLQHYCEVRRSRGQEVTITLTSHLEAFFLEDLVGVRR